MGFEASHDGQTHGSRQIHGVGPASRAIFSCSHFFFLFLILIWCVVVLTFIFLRLIMCHMMIGCRKMAGLH
jgi:hypothetical protein